MWTSCKQASSTDTHTPATTTYQHTSTCQVGLWIRRRGAGKSATGPELPRTTQHAQAHARNARTHSLAHHTHTHHTPTTTKKHQHAGCTTPLSWPRSTRPPPSVSSPTPSSPSSPYTASCSWSPSPSSCWAAESPVTPCMAGCSWTSPTWRCSASSFYLPWAPSALTTTFGSSICKPALLLSRALSRPWYVREKEG